MDWLRRKESFESSPAPAPAASVSGRVERPTRGVADLLEGVSEDRSHSFLDLGPAADSSLRVFSRYARWIRFVDLLSDATPETDWPAALASIPEHPQRAYDVVLAWNILDRVPPEVRPQVIARLSEISAPDARLFLVIEPSGSGPRYPLRFGLVDSDQLWYEPAGHTVSGWPPLLPAELERLIAPFQVARAFTTQVGLREYVAVRRRR